MIRALTLILLVLSVVALLVGCDGWNGSPVQTDPDTGSLTTDPTDVPTQPTDDPAVSTESPEPTGSVDAPDPTLPSTDRNGFPNLPSDDETKRY